MLIREIRSARYVLANIRKRERFSLLLIVLLFGSIIIGDLIFRHVADIHVDWTQVWARVFFTLFLVTTLFLFNALQVLDDELKKK